jgi:hypothetical protein
MYLKGILSLYILFSTSLYASEKLYGFWIDNNGITINVSSGGCTSKSSFTHKVTKIKKVYEIDFVRTQMDACEAFYPYGTKLTFAFGELGLTRGSVIKIKNEVITKRNIF